MIDPARQVTRKKRGANPGWSESHLLTGKAKQVEEAPLPQPRVMPSGLLAAKLALATETIKETIFGRIVLVMCSCFCYQRGASVVQQPHDSDISVHSSP